MRKRRFTAGVAVMLVVLTAVSTFVITYYLAGEHYSRRFGDLNEVENEYAKFKEVSSVIDSYFIGEYDMDEAMESAMAGYVDGLGDQWSAYYTPQQTELLLQANGNAYVGVGVTIAGGEESPYSITQVTPGGPAEKAGVLPFDVITHVDGIAVSDIGGQEDVISSVRGIEGTAVRLTVDRDGQSLSFDIKRASVYYEQVSARMLEGDIGYIYVAGFETNVDKEFKTKLDSLIAEGARGIIFDVRMNPGGAVNIMVNMLDLLLPAGTVISMKDNAGNERQYSSDEACIQMPMVVLVNENSISAAEFFAAALQEYAVAQVVGSKTTGKGYAQQLFQLSDGSSINLSVMRYYTPKGNSLVDTGVTPDYEIDLSDEAFYNFYYLAYEEDTQLVKAVEVITPQLPAAEEQLPDEADETGETTAPAA